jgi:outer membrane protein TolC
MRAILSVIFGLFAFASVLPAQDADSTSKSISFQAFLNQVQIHHPMAAQANLQRQFGEASVLRARGAFDPVVYTDYQQKMFNDSEYYQLLDGGLKVPTWFGLEFKGGYEQTEGVYLNPEHNTPTGGLLYAGVSLPIGQGLFIDQRRAGLRMAQIYRESTEAIRLEMLNDLLYEAGSAYWEWFAAYHTVQVFENTLDLAIERLEAVKVSARIGELPAIDTVEAGIQVQNLQLSLQQAQLDYRNARELLAVYLWADGMVPLELEETTFPAPLVEVPATEVDPDLLNELNTLVENHPILRQYRYKLDELRIDQRWKREQLKPELNLQYNFLNEALFGETWGTFSPNNYKVGLEFKMPLLLRRERGNLQITNLKIQETELELSNKSAFLFFKAVAALNTWELSKQQVDLYTQTVNDLNRLLNGERQLFDLGESSLFLVNTREINYVNAQVRLIGLLAKNRKASMESSFALGILAGF